MDVDEEVDVELEVGVGVVLVEVGELDVGVVSDVVDGDSDVVALKTKTPGWFKNVVCQPLT